MSQGRTKPLLVVLIAGLGAVLAMPTLSSARIKERNRLFVSMDGDNEPGGGDANGNGFGMVDLFPRRRQVCFNLSWSDIAEPVADAHIHKGVAGVSGDVKVPLWGPDQSGGNAAGCVPNVRRSLIENLRDHPRRFYVNLHNGDFPDGAIRGQLMQNAPVCGGTCWPEPPKPRGG
jgi:hypothetical protein